MLAVMDLSAFNDYEREFLSLTSQLQPRISQLLQYTTDAEQANAEIKRIDSDLTTAKQHVSGGVTGRLRAHVHAAAAPSWGTVAANRYGSRWSRTLLTTLRTSAPPAAARHAS